jgi:hypothetical protein
MKAVPFAALVIRGCARVDDASLELRRGQRDLSGDRFDAREL